MACVTKGCEGSVSQRSQLGLCRQCTYDRNRAQKLVKCKNHARCGNLTKKKSATGLCRECYNSVPARQRGSQPPWYGGRRKPTPIEIKDGGVQDVLAAKGVRHDGSNTDGGDDAG